MLFKIFIVEWNRPDVWKECLDSWINTVSGDNDIEIFYIDSGSNDDNQKILLEKYKRQRKIKDYFCFEENVGPAKARNKLWIPEIVKSTKDDIFVKFDL